MMSWFDTTGIANLAKSALKEAQKTIDKALDIKEDESKSNVQSKAQSPAVVEDADNFFSSWGLKSSNEKELIDKIYKVGENSNVESATQNQSPRASSKLGMTTSLWGSFTGSFFENPKTTEENLEFFCEETNTVSMQPKKAGLFRTNSLQNDRNITNPRKNSWDQSDLFQSIESEEVIGLCDDCSESGVDDGFSRSKLVVESEDGDNDPDFKPQDVSIDVEKIGTLSSESRKEDPISLDDVPRRSKPSGSNFKCNRLSVISSESDKKSSESVEVIGSECGSSVTTSPDSDLCLLSPGVSSSSSVIGLRSSGLASSPESVEVIPDTPSSVEVLPEVSSGRTSRTTSSPYVSPDAAVPPSFLPIKPDTERVHFPLERQQKCEKEVETSPESVEVIPEEEDEEADDSYTSASESTVTVNTTVIELSNKSPHHSSAESSLYSSTISSGKGHVEAPIPTHSGCRTGLQLALNVQEVLKPVEKVVSEHNEDVLLPTDVRTLVCTDSSGEGTLMESSSEDAATVVEDDGHQSSSYYVKTMLADAMDEEEPRLMPARDHSPISSESRSDMVKIESEQTSGHTSGDELETTTSSDIEIISSPNGDSSSTHSQSRHSPAKLLQRATRGKFAHAVAERTISPSCETKSFSQTKVKGHQRELSETSSGGSDDSHCLEVEKLLKRIAEMTDILEARESKLIETSRINVELQETNSELRSQLETAFMTKVKESQDVTEEFTQRLSSLERKFQQAIRERDSLRKQLEQARQDAASRLSKGELEDLIAEKDEVICELREEGEKLSKQQLQHSNIIKKLRAKEKDNDNIIKNQKEQLEELNQEVERLKRSLSAKEEVERSQIEAVHQLTARTKWQEKELVLLRSQLDDANQKVETLRVSLEGASKEITECRKTVAAKESELEEATKSVDNLVRQELQSALQEAQNVSQEERQQLLGVVEELRQKLCHSEEDYSRKEASLRQEAVELLRRLEAAEARSEELTQSVSGSTRPILRQLEMLQAASSTQQATWEKQERALSDTIVELQSKISALMEQERSTRDQNVTLQSRVSSLESRMALTVQDAAQLKSELQKSDVQFTELKTVREKELQMSESLRKGMTEQLSDLRREITALEHQLALERTAVEAEKRRTTLLQEQLREREILLERERAGIRVSSSPVSPRSSPTLSFGRASLSESVSSSAWPQFPDESFETASSSGRLINVYESLRSGNTTSLLEGLQAQLKLRDGEVQQLQWELSRREAERSALTTEVSSLIAKIEDQKLSLSKAENLKTQFQDIQHKYDALLQMYGEKVEETQELRLDLQDVKEMYKTQIDQLLQKESSS